MHLRAVANTRHRPAALVPQGFQPDAAAASRHCVAAVQLRRGDSAATIGDMTPSLLYRIECAHPGAHLFNITLTVAAPNPAGCRLSLPAWIPGSYMIREFARNIVRISAHSGGARTPVKLTKLDKHTWQAAPCAGPLRLDYEVYAWDLSVRAAHLDETHAFFNGSSVFLCVAGQEQARHEVEIVRPAGPAYTSWRVATSLARSGATAAYGFGRYVATGYDELIDHPVELGTFSLIEFSACGVPHAMVITGQHDCDMPRLAADLTRVCEAQIRLFHGARATRRDVPFDRYVFLTLAVGEGYGGLEHRASTALICARHDLPHAGLKKTSEGYRTFLGLCSHEYFHAWNVKRIRPAAFTPYDLTRENYTRQLWAFEGITSYYDDLMLLRAGLISQSEYLDTLAKTIRAVQRGAGRLKQPVAESSFDAWIKFYRQDENAPNAIVSYYAKGALVALCLDLLLREGSGGRASLDDVIRRLWQRYGATGAGVPEGGIEKTALETGALGGPRLQRRLSTFFANAVDGSGELPLKRLLQHAGFTLKMTPGTGPALGARTAAAPDGVKLTHVLDGGGAQAAGLSAGDVMIAIAGVRVTPASLEAHLARKRRSARVRVHAFRRDELIERDVRLGTAEIEVTLTATAPAPSSPTSAPSQSAQQRQP